MRVLVTGANGFIGRALCRRCSASTSASSGFEIRALVRPGSALGGIDELPGIEVVHGDVLSAESLRLAAGGAEAVVHLAGTISAGRDATYARTNFEGSRNIAVAANEAGARRFIFMSSLAAQGPSAVGQPHRLPGNESPLDSYGRSKLEAERALTAELSPGQLTILRPATVYGPDYGELAQIIRLVRGRILPVVVGLELSFLHVEDLVDLVLKVLELKGEAVGPFFVSDGGVHTMERVVDRLEALVCEGPAVRLPVPPRVLAWLGPVAQKLADSTGLGASVSRHIEELRATGWACLPDEACRQLGFRISRPLDLALPEVVAWYRDRGDLERNWVTRRP